MASSRKEHKRNSSENYYFNNAATSFPKPESVIQAINDFLVNGGINKGREVGIGENEAGDFIALARKKISYLIKNPSNNLDNIIFAANATDALNQIVHGILKKGDRVITTSTEHNSVLRPLFFLQDNGIIKLSIIPADETGAYDVNQIREGVENEKTKMVIINHASNVNGRVYPLGEIGKICEESGTTFVVDGSQSLGSIPVDVVKDKIDVLAFTGHKSLLGPPGIGGFYLRNGLEDSMVPLKQGGTGFFSESTRQPSRLPYKYESGTPNFVGIVGLLAGVDFVLNKGLDEILHHDRDIVQHMHRIITGLNAEFSNGITFNHDFTQEFQAPIISINIHGLIPEQLGHILSSNFRIITRTGLHCAPLMHQSLGTFPAGTVRFSFGIFNTVTQVEYLDTALRSILKNVGS